MDSAGNPPSFLQDHGVVDMDSSHEVTEELQNHPDPLQSLIQGEEIMLKINPRSLLIYIMQALGVGTEPVFTEKSCGHNGLRVEIKLDVSDLKTVSGERLLISVVEGQASLEHHVAENSAVQMAFIYLQEKHGVRIFDFSSRILGTYESCGIYALICKGIDLVEKFYTDWDMSLNQCENFGLNVVGNQYTGIFSGHLSESGKIYAILGDVLSVILPKLKVKTEQARADLNELHNTMKDYDNNMSQSDNNGGLHAVDLELTDLLAFLMFYFNLDEPEFTNGPAANDMVASSVLMKFPEMHKHKFSGNIMLEAKAYSSIEATKEVAFHALVFIEKNFPVKIIDFNYSKREEKLEQLKKLIGVLSKLFEVFVAVRMMWCKLNNVLEGNAGLYSFDPSSIFAGIDSGGQAEAYLFCYNGLEDLKTQSLNRLASCGVYIEGLEKLTWEFHVMKSKLGL